MSGCITFRGELQEIASTEVALQSLQRHEGVWIGRVQPDDGAEKKSEYMARLFRHNGQFKLHINLYDPKRKDLIRNEVYDIEAVEAQKGLVILGYHRTPGKTKVECMVLFLDIDAKKGKVFFLAKQDEKTGSKKDTIQDVTLTHRELLKLSQNPMEFFDARRWVAVRFVDTDELFRTP